MAILDNPFGALEALDTQISSMMKGPIGVKISDLCCRRKTNWCLNSCQSRGGMLMSVCSKSKDGKGCNITCDCRDGTILEDPGEIFMPS